MNQPADRIAVAGLTACVFGCLLVPLCFLALGALREFKEAFAVVVLPPLWLSIGFLVYRYVWTQAPAGRISSYQLAGEGLSWLVLSAFVFLASGMRLLVGLERAGLCALFFLIGSAISAPLAFLRETPLRQRLSKVPSKVGVGLLGFLLLLAAVLSSIYLIRPPAFL
jgi:hypothetical protein